MVHKRYVYKNGRKYGPYYYHSYRDSEGKVKKHYLKGIVAFSRLEFLWFAIGILAFGFSIFMLARTLFANFI